MFTRKTLSLTLGIFLFGGMPWNSASARPLLSPQDHFSYQAFLRSRPNKIQVDLGRSSAFSAPPSHRPSPTGPENMLTVAGHRACNNYFSSGPATAASLHTPVRIAVNQVSLFLKEFDGGEGIRRVELGPLPTIEKMFFSFLGLFPVPVEGSFVFDAEGNMFAIEFGFIPKIDPITRIVFPCAGDGTLGD